jgi:hypothetical protein
MSPVYKYTVVLGSPHENVDQEITAKNRKEADLKFSEMWPGSTPLTVIEPKKKKTTKK